MKNTPTNVPRRLNFVQLVLLLLLAPPIGLYLLTIFGKTGDWVLNPVAAGSFLLAETFAFWGVFWGMISLGFPFWQILLGLSAVCLVLTVLNLLGRVIFSK